MELLTFVVCKRVREFCLDMKNTAAQYRPPAPSSQMPILPDRKLLVGSKLKLLVIAAHILAVLQSKDVVSRHPNQTCTLIQAVHLQVGTPAQTLVQSLPTAQVLHLG